MKTVELKQIRCVCGALIYGTSLIHCKANMKAHKISKKHKELMEIKQFGAVAIIQTA